MQSLIGAKSLSQSIPLKAHIKDLKREFHQLKKKLRKIEDELKKSKKGYTKVLVEINRLRQSSKQFFKKYTAKKYYLTEELEWATKLASDNTWTSTAKICSLEAKLREAKEKIS